MKKKSSVTTGTTGSVSERLKLIRACPMCSHEYRGGEAHVLEEYEGSQLLHITCPKCRNALLALIVASPAGMSSVCMCTDLTVVDMIRLRGRSPVGEDDLLSFHEHLRTPAQFEHSIIRNGSA